jgi:hypothetical protein
VETVLRFFIAKNRNIPAQLRKKYLIPEYLRKKSNKDGIVFFGVIWPLTTTFSGRTLESELFPDLYWKKAVFDSNFWHK